MSSFEVLVQPITVSPHPDPETTALEIGTVEGQAYTFVVAKGYHQTGKLGAYIPEGAIVPPNIIADMGLEGRLAGPDQNRVKAVRLRKALSQGLFYSPDPLPSHWVAGLDVTDELGITKWEPPIPIEMQGQAEAIPGSSILRRYTDIENWQRYPNVLIPGEPVEITEKLHGTCFIAGLIRGQFCISSLGLAKAHLMLTESDSNVYWRAARQHDIEAKLRAFCEHRDLDQVVLYGEVIGVQDLKYGLTKGQIQLAAFDLLYSPGDAFEPEFLSVPDFHAAAAEMQVPTVPVLYSGPFDHAVTLTLAAGKSTVADNIREGVVVKPEFERRDLSVGRVAMKYISEQYLTRKGGTESH